MLCSLFDFSGKCFQQRFVCCKSSLSYEFYDFALRDNHIVHATRVYMDLMLVLKLKIEEIWCSGDQHWHNLPTVFADLFTSVWDMHRT